MRLIGHIQEEARARTFSEALWVEGIDNQIEGDGEAGWGVWVHDEDHLEAARNHLTAFLKDPDNPAYQQVAEQAAHKRAQEEQAQKELRKRYFDRDRLFPQPVFGLGAVTIGLIAVSVIVSLLGWGGFRGLDFLVLVLPEILQGQVWRLVTPIFLHFGILHLVFNMFWLARFGGMIEARQGTAWLALLVLLFAIPSNFGQYLVSGPGFGGMSGVVYGLFGYIWLRGKLDPGSGLFVDEITITILVGWFLLCLMAPMGPLPNIANTAHAVGLGVGALIGYLTAMAHHARGR